MIIYIYFYLSALDMVSRNNKLLRTILAARLAGTVVLAAVFYDHSTHAVLYHCIVDNERRTFLRGEYQWLGLSEYYLQIWLIIV